MSPEMQQWSHKSRSRINNLYLLTRPIAVKCAIVAIIGSALQVVLLL